MKKIFFDKIFKSLGITEKDIVFISSNLLKLNIKKKKQLITYETSDIIDSLINILKNHGTIIVPTFNWDFCNGKGYHYKKTLSNSGSLGNYVLKRSDFDRTQNPIYSFCVYGKDKKYLTSLKHKSCFEFNSPFGYMVTKNAKNIYIDIDNIYRDSFTLCHVAEQKVGVNYRYLKNFKGKYVNKGICKLNANFSMYVRKLNLNIRTGVNPQIKKELKKKNSYIERNISGINLKVVNMKNAYKIMENSLKNKGNIIFKDKL
ncbi:AAC(3) family N-acetyltransferase [Candidatus Pelagibacter sp.]|nr:AAC(3) family N-acetyltransferase [Candidatus Pelagibacter sp.]